MTVDAIPLLSLSTLGDDESRLVHELGNRLSVYEAANAEAVAYYEGTQTVQQFGISIPPSMRNASVVAGWGGTVVDVLEERLDWLGWASEVDTFGLDEVYRANALDVESGMAHLDALIFGTSFLAVGSGEPGEPSPLITPHSPRTMTGLWDARARRLAAALAISGVENGQVVEWTLYLPGETVQVRRADGRLVVTDRDRHNLGRVPIVKMPNRIRASREAGRSEITKAVRYYTDAAVRTLLGLEVNREFYNAPQRIGLNIPADAFQDDAGNALSQWSAIQGRVWMVPPNEDPDAPTPDVKQFNSASPAPYLDQIRGYATQLAAEAGIPAAYLGIHTDNPSSADAIRALESRLIKRAERRQSTFGRAWLEVGRLALMVRDGAVPDTFDTLTTRWRDAATPTRAAAADEALKLTSGENPILPPDSTVTYDRIGLSPAEQRQVEADKRRAQAGPRLDALLTAARGGSDAVER